MSRPTIYVYEILDGFVEICSKPMGQVDYKSQCVRINLMDSRCSAKEICTILIQCGINVNYPSGAEALNHEEH